MVKVRLLLTLILLLLLTPILGIQPAHADRTYFVTLYAESDAYINSASPGANYGTEPFLEVGTNLVMEFHPTYRSLVWFDLSDIPADATIKYAYLKLYLKEGGDAQVRVERITSPWNETSVTWHNQPSIWRYDGMFIPLVEDVGAPGMYTWEVTSWVQSWFRGDYENYGLMVMALREDVDSSCVFYSRDVGDHRIKPQLEVSYESGTPPPPPTPTPPPEPTDTSPPTVTIDIRPPADIRPTDSVAITVTATDDIGLRGLKVTVNGVIIPPEGPWETSESGVLEHSIVYRSTFDYGTYTVVAQAWDRAANLGWASKQFRVMGGGQPPVVTIACDPSEVFPNDNATLEVTVTANDPEGVRRLTVGVGYGFSSPSSYPDYGHTYTYDPPRTTLTIPVSFNNLNIPGNAIDATKIIVRAEAQDAEYLWSDIAEYEIKVIRPYQWDYGVPYHNQARNELPWQVMDDIFSWGETHNCGPLGEVCWKTMWARAVWRDVKDLAKAGECFGMSAYSVIHFKPFGIDHGVSIDDSYQHTGREYFLRPEWGVDFWHGWGQDSVQRSIERFHGAQFSDEVLDHLIPQLFKQYRDKHIGSFIDKQLPRLQDDIERGTPGILCMTKDMGLGTAGHCVVPWYIEDVQDGWRIYVYDPNREIASLFSASRPSVTIAGNTLHYNSYDDHNLYPVVYVQTHGKRFSFIFADGSLWDGFLTYVPFDVALKNDYDLPDGLAGLVIVFASTDAETYVEDAEGKRTGVVDGTLVVDIEDSSPIFLPTLGADKQMYSLPLERPYDIHVKGKSSGEYNWWTIGEGSFYGISDKTCSRLKEDTISITKSKEYTGYSLRIHAEVADDNFGIGMAHKLGDVSREYEMENTTVSDDGDIQVYVEEGGDSLVIINYGNDPVSTEIVFRSTESDTQAREKLSIAPGEQVTVTDDWENLGKAPLEVKREKIGGGISLIMIVIIAMIVIIVSSVAVAAAVLIAVVTRRRKGA